MGKQVSKKGTTNRFLRKFQASRIFTDRQEPRASFWDNYKRVKNSLLALNIMI